MYNRIADRPNFPTFISIEMKNNPSTEISDPYFSILPTLSTMWLSGLARNWVGKCNIMITGTGT